MTILNDTVAYILGNYIEAYCDADGNEDRLLIAARLVGALDMALATAEVKDGN